MKQEIPGQQFGWGEGSVALSADGRKRFLALGADDFGQPNSIYTQFSSPAPQLNLAPAGLELALSWTFPSTNFVLQQSSDLMSTVWDWVTNKPVLNLNNLQNEVLLPLPNANRFYRLATPLKD